MDIEITKKDGTTFRLSDYNIQVADIKVQGIETTDKYQEFEGCHGRQLTSSVYHKRKILVPVFFIAENNLDYSLQRDFLFQLIQDNEPFYLRELRKYNKASYKFKDTIEDEYQEVDKNGNCIFNDNDNVYVNGYHFLVKLSNTLIPNQTNNKCNVELEFETTELPFAESINTSLQLHYSSIDGNWSSDMDIDFDEKSKQTYIFENISKGKVFYHGTVANNQFNMYKKVTIVVGKETDKFTWNLSDSKVMTVKNTLLLPGDVLVYDNLNIKKNGVIINRKSNIEMPKFSPGFNNFTFNQNVKKVMFDLRFYKK